MSLANGPSVGGWPVIYSALEPVPVEGCDVCGALNVQRREARERFDWAELKAINSEIASHPHDGAEAAR